MDKLKEFAKRFSSQKLFSAIRVFDHAAQHTSVGWQPGLQLELAAARTIEPEEEKSINANEAKPATIAAVRPPSSQNPPAKQSTEKTSIHQNSHQAQVPVKEKPVQDSQETKEKIESNEISTQTPGGSLGNLKNQWNKVGRRQRKFSETAALSICNQQD